VLVVLGLAAEGEDLLDEIAGAQARAARQREVFAGDLVALDLVAD
jgi:hypothetical protein